MFSSKKFWKNHLSLWLIKQILYHTICLDWIALEEAWVLLQISLTYPGRRIK